QWRPAAIAEPARWTASSWTASSWFGSFWIDLSCHALVEMPPWTLPEEARRANTGHRWMVPAFTDAVNRPFPRVPGDWVEVEIGLTSYRRYCAAFESLMCWLAIASGARRSAARRHPFNASSRCCLTRIDHAALEQDRPGRIIDHVIEKRM